MSSRSPTAAGGREVASHGEDVPAVDPGDRFSCLFAGQLDAITALAEAAGVEIGDVAKCYFELVDAADSMLSHSELQDRLGLSAPRCWDVASVLVEFGEISRAKDGQWWWVYCSDYLAERCRERELSLKRYIEMRPVLSEFQDDVVRWYQIRHMHGNLQPETMGEIKLRYCQRLQQEYWGLEEGEAVVDEDSWSDHRVSRYVRTAQDVIVEAHNLTY